MVRVAPNGSWQTLTVIALVCLCACGGSRGAQNGSKGGAGGGAAGGATGGAAGATGGTAGGGVAGGTAGATGGGAADWSVVEAKVRAASADAGVADMALYVYSGVSDARVYTLELGSFRSSTNIAVASASKWVSAMVVFDVIRRGQLSLDSTTGGALGWSGPLAGITLRQLLSFTSGIEADPACTRNPLVTLANCVATIGASAPVADAGTRYDYGSGHLHVAARMAETVTGRSWEQLFDEVLRQPLRLSTSARYYTAPMQSVGTLNPLVAGGLRTTTDDYAKLLALEYHRGAFGSVRVGTTALFDAQAVEPYPNVAVGSSPVAELGLAYRYGLAAWLECATPSTGCQRLSSPGAFGFTPWIDREHRYYAILAMEIPRSTSGVVGFSVHTAAAIQPDIAAAMAR